MGVAQSFISLLAYIEEADYYAFCDQDDIWLPNKIERAVKMLENEEWQGPMLYFSNYDYYDEKMDYIGHANLHFPQPSFPNALVECICPGMSMMINRELRDKIVSKPLTKVMYHDWLVYLIATGMGKVIYDEEVTIKYRRHSRNVSNTKQNFFQFQWWRIKQIIQNAYFKKVKEQLIEFEQNYGKQLDTEKQEVLHWFTEKTYCLGSVFRKITYPQKFRQRVLDDLLLRILFLIGVL